MLQLVCQVRARQPRIGVRKLYHLLKAEFEKLDCNLGRDALFGLLRDHRLLVERPKAGPRTTFANHRFHRYPNRIANLTIHRIHQVFVADITYVFLVKAVKPLLTRVQPSVAMDFRTLISSPSEYSVQWQKHR